MTNEELQKKRDELALAGCNRDGNTLQFKKGWDACQKELQSHLDYIKKENLANYLLSEELKEKLEIRNSQLEAEKKAAGKLVEALGIHTHHFESEDGFYSCPKAENYFGNHAIECTCGKEEAEIALAAYRRHFESGK